MIYTMSLPSVTKTSKWEVANHLDFRHGLVCCFTESIVCLIVIFFTVFDLTRAPFQNYIHSFENNVDRDQMKSGDQDLHTFEHRMNL